MGKICVDPISNKGGESWEKLLEQNFSLSGYTTSSSESTFDSESFTVNATGFDMLLVEVSGKIAITSGTIAGLQMGGVRLFSGPGEGRFRAVLMGGGNGWFYQTNSSSMINFGFSSDFSIGLTGRNVNASATVTVRVFGKKIDV